MKKFLTLILFILISCSNGQKLEDIKNVEYKIKESTKDKDSWKGKYYFEATKRDSAKTIFDITISSLEDITLTVIEEGVKNKYSHLKAEEVDNEKIKITYDNSSDDMGVIYIKKSDNDYFISGNPIYFINPGNNEMPIQKVRQ